MSLKIIGIIGKSGVGKSTVANYLSEKLDNVKILEVDKIHMNYLLSHQTDKLKKMFGDDIIVNGKLNNVHFSNFPEKQKRVFYESFDDLETILLNEIEDIKEKYDWLIIDYFILVLLKKIWDLCHYRILVEAVSDNKRYENIVLRNAKKDGDIPRDIKEELRSRDHFIQDYKKYKYDFYLLNNYNDNFKKDLDILIDRIFKSTNNGE